MKCHFKLYEMPSRVNRMKPWLFLEQNISQRPDKVSIRKVDSAQLCSTSDSSEEGNLFAYYNQKMDIWNEGERKWVRE